MTSQGAKSVGSWRTIGLSAIDFSGRTGRRDYWMLVLAWLAFVIADITTGIVRLDYETPQFVFLLLFLLPLISLVPMAAATVRRLRDAKRSGFWLLLVFIIPLGWLGLAFLCARPTASEASPYRQQARPKRGILRKLGRYLRAGMRRINRGRIGVVAPSSIEHIRGSVQDARRIVILIHGTYASGAAWVRSGAFVDHVSATPGTTVYAFRWTGANSHSARLSAGRDLAREISRLSQNNTPVHLLGHSHGGNVALYALRDSSVAKRVHSLGFLGTPFIHQEPGDFHKLASTFSHVASWFVVFPGWLPLGAMALIELVSFSGVLLTLGLFVINPAIVYAYIFHFRIPFRRFVERTLVRHWETRARFVRGWLRQPVPCCPTFVAKVDFDEARIWLRAIDAASSMPSLGIRLAAAAIGAGTISLIALAFVAMAYDTTVIEVAEVEVVLLAIILTATAVIVGPLLMTLWVSTLRGSAVGFGSEGLVGGMASRIYASADPEWKPSNDCIRRLLDLPST